MNLYFTFENKVALEKKMENIWFIFLHFQVPQRKLGKELKKGSSGKKTTKAVSAFFLLTILMRMQQYEKNKVLPIIVYLLIQGRLELYGRMPTLKGFWLDYYEGDTFYEY